MQLGGRCAREAEHAEGVRAREGLEVAARLETDRARLERRRSVVALLGGRVVGVEEARAEERVHKRLRGEDALDDGVQLGLAVLVVLLEQLEHRHVVEHRVLQQPASVRRAPRELRVGTRARAHAPARVPWVHAGTARQRTSFKSSACAMSCGHVV